MSTSLVVVGVIALAVLGYGIFVYNALVTDRNRVLAGWSDVEVQLKRRHDLIPKLVDTVRQYAAYEQATLSAVTELRAQGEAIRGIRARAEVETALGSGLRRLFALVEGYPQLKADTVFLDLQQAITEVEEHIQFARRYFNGAVRAFNTRIESFPDLLVARWMAFEPADYFELDDDRIEGSAGPPPGDGAGRP